MANDAEANELQEIFSPISKSPPSSPSSSEQVLPLPSNTSHSQAVFFVERNREQSAGIATAPEAKAPASTNTTTPLLEEEPAVLAIYGSEFGMPTTPFTCPSRSSMWAQGLETQPGASNEYQAQAQA